MKKEQMAQVKELAQKIEGFESSREDGGLTANESAIISHYLSMSNHAYGLMELTAQLDLIENYISLLQYSFTRKPNNTENSHALYYALFSEGGFDNMQSVLSGVSKSLRIITNDLI